VTVPLVMPAQDARGLSTELAGSSLVVQSKGVTASLAANSDWTSHDQTGGIMLVSQSGAEEVELMVSAAGVPEPVSTVIDRAYIQTWLTTDARQDRAVYRFWTGENGLRISLPAGAQSDAVRVLLDGRPIPYRVPTEGELVLLLRGDQPREHVLELSYPFRSRPAVGALRLDIPVMEGTRWTRQLFWQLITPGEEHLLAGPRTMSREDRWAWNGWRWGPRPRHGQRQLERWAGGMHQYQPPVSVNEYLFSSFGPVDRLSARTGMRHLILAVCSGLVLVVGLVLIYVPLLRRPPVLLTGAVALAAAGAQYPSSALVFVQAGGLGLMLVALARVLLWVVARKHPLRPLVHGRSYPGPDTRSTELIAPPRDDVSRGTSSGRGSRAIVSTPDAKP
jgi:hypothetical protein